MSYVLNYKFQPALQIQNNSNKTFEFEIRDNFNKIIDLTSSTGQIKIFLEKLGENSNPIITKSITLIEPEKGLCQVTLDDSDTGIEANLYKYRLEFNFGVDDTKVFGDGVFDILGDDNSRIMQIKRNRGLSFDYYHLETALEQARNSLKNYVYQEEEFEAKQPDNVYKINNFVADSNFDGVIDKNDITMIEYQKESPYNINDLNANINNFISNHPNGYTIIEMDDSYPSDDSYTVRITYNKIMDDYNKIKNSLLKLEELYVIQYLFEILEPYKLQRGITDKTIGNQTISFNQQAISDYQDKLRRQILSEMINLKPLVNKSVNISKGY